MSDFDTIFEGDEGTRIELEIQEEVDGALVAVDVSTASVKQVKLTDPGGTTTVHTAQFTTDGTDGLIFYSLVEADTLDKIGLWSARGYCEIGSWKGHSTVYNFVVREVI